MGASPPGRGARDVADVRRYSGLEAPNKSSAGTAESGTGGASVSSEPPSAELSSFHAGVGGAAVVRNRRSRYSSNRLCMYSGLYIPHGAGSGAEDDSTASLLGRAAANSARCSLSFGHGRVRCM